MVLLAVDVGFGLVKGLSSDGRKVSFRSTIGAFQPVKFSSGMSASSSGRSVAIEYDGRQIFVGDAALLQSTPEATIDARRTVSFEGMALLMAAFSFLTPGKSTEDVKLVVGLPVLHYARLKNEYIKAAKTIHEFFELSFTGGLRVKKMINVVDVKVLPQPFGACFDLLLNDAGQVKDQHIAEGSIGVIDNGYNTLDLLRVEGLEYLEPRSKSFSEAGAFSVCRDLSEKLYQRFGVELPPEKVEKYLDKDVIVIRGKSELISGLKAECYTNQALNIISRVKSTWPDYPLLGLMPLVGGGIVNISEHLQRELGDAAAPVADPVWSNVSGYLKFGKRVWKQ